MIARLPLPVGMANRSMPLDALRCLAVSLVIGFHVAVESDPIALDAAARWLGRYGPLGVDIFFPLSGFLITGFLLRRHAPADIRVFFLRRVFRILPLYLAAVATYAVASMMTGNETDLIARLWIPLTFLTGWMIFADGAATVPYTITWSLSVEEFAYILFGLAALAAGRRLVAVLAGVAIFAILLRIALISNGATDVHFLPPARLDAIAIGGLLAALRPAEGTRWRQIAPPLALGAAAAFALWYWSAAPAFSATGWYLAITFSTCTAITLLVGPLATGGRHLSEAQGLLGGLLRFSALIGFYSYFIYLFHYFAVFGVNLILDQAGLSLGYWLRCALVLMLTTLAAAVSHRWFEAPMMRLGRWLEIGRLQREAQPPAAPALTGRR